MQLIPRRLSRCVLEGESFEQGAEYISFLDMQGNRQDYCPCCWERIRKPVEGHFWKGKIPLKKEKNFHSDEKALALFRRQTDPKKRFVLALYLQRKQQLVRRTQTLYEIPETGEVFDLEKVTISAAEADTLAHEVDRMIDAYASQ